MQYTEIFKVVKNENFQEKIFAIFLIFTQNTDCGYPQYMFWSKDKNQRTNGPVNAHLRSVTYANKHV